MASKSINTFKNAWSVLDSDEEHDGASSSCCSSSSCRHVAPKTFAGLALAEIEERIVRRRFWPYPTEAEERLSTAWPCISCCPWQHDEGDFWECDHGKWFWVNSWASVPPVPEDHTLEQCRGGSCSGHGLLTGDILALHLASEAGLGWGDIVFMEDTLRRAAESSTERAARLAYEARKDAERITDMAEAEIRKAKELVALRPAPKQRRYDRRTGKPMPCRYFLACSCDRVSCSINKDGNLPPLSSCSVVVGKPYPEARTAAGTMWESGCAYHKKGKCEFFHPDEPEWQVITGKVASVPSRPSTPTEPEWRSGGGAASSGPRSAGAGGFGSRPGSGGSGGGRGGFGSGFSGSQSGRW